MINTKNGDIQLNIMITTKGYDIKPKDEEMIAIHTKYLQDTTTSIDNFAEQIRTGHAFIGAKFENEEESKNSYVKHNIDNFKTGCIAVMDFDNGTWTEKSVLSYCEKYNIMPNIYYRSFSYTERLNKMHLIWAIGECDYNVMVAIQKMLYYAFAIEKKGKKEEDKKSYAPTQLWQGTNKDVKVLSYNYLNLVYVMSCIKQHATKGHESNVLADVKKFSGIDKVIGINQWTYNSAQGYNGLVLQSYVDGSSNRIAIFGDFRKFISSHKDFSEDYTGAKLQNLCDRCQLFRELSNQKCDYYNHDIGFGMMTALENISNGIDGYLAIEKHNGSKSEAKYKADFNCGKNYFASPCKGYCPYYNSCKYGKHNPAYASQDVAYKTVKHDPSTIKQISVEEAYNQTETMISDIMRPMYSEIFDKYVVKVDDSISDKTRDEKYKDIGSSDFATGLLKQHEKMAWMLRSYLR